MTTYYYCQNDPGAASGCVPGNDTNNGLTPATARRTYAQFCSDWEAGTAGDQFLLAQGGFWAGAASGQIHNLNATKANPVVMGTYDASSVWSGGAGIKPILSNTAGAIILNLNKGTIVHTEGYLIQGIQFQGLDGTTGTGIYSANDTDWVTLQNLTFRFLTTGIQCNVGTSAPSATNDGICEGWMIDGCTFYGCSIGALIGQDNLTVVNSTFDHCGATIFDHGLYVGGGQTSVFPQPIASITGDGTTALLTTTVPHKIPVGDHFVITVTGSTSSGTGSFNVSSARGVSTGSLTMTYAATGAPSASVVGSYTLIREVKVSNITIRGNTFRDGNLTGQGNNAHLVVHGYITGLLIENNFVQETVGAAAGTCVGIEVDDGGYGPPEEYEGFYGVIIRNNTLLDTAVGIALDTSDAALVENNYHYTTFAAGAVGIQMRSRYNSPLSPTKQIPTRNLIRYNTVYLTAPVDGYAGIMCAINAADTLGVGFGLYGNVVVLGASATTTTKAFSAANIPNANFVLKNYNSCYYLGGAVPKWQDGATLAATQTAGSDQNSVMAFTANVVSGQPFFTSPALAPTVAGSSELVGSGAPGVYPRLCWGGKLRTVITTPTKGAAGFNPGAVVPNSQVPQTP